MNVICLSTPAWLALRRAVKCQRQVACTGAEVENRRVALRHGGAHRLPSPVLVDVHRQQMVEQIVTSGDLAEHLPDACAGLVDHYFSRGACPLAKFPAGTSPAAKRFMRMI
jgi:hypothetical protein